MTGIALDSPEITARFDAICAQVGERGQGVTLRQLGACHALARELEAPEPDEGKVADHAHALGIDPRELR
jgi:hypothetical protein